MAPEDLLICFKLQKTLPGLVLNGVRWNWKWGTDNVNLVEALRNYKHETSNTNHSPYSLCRLGRVNYQTAESFPWWAA